MICGIHVVHYTGGFITDLQILTNTMTLALIELSYLEKETKTKVVLFGWAETYFPSVMHIGYGQ